MPTIKRRKRASGLYWELRWTEPNRTHEPRRGQRSRTLGPCSEVSEHQAQIALKAKEIELGQRSRERSQAPTFAAWCKSYLTWHEREFPSSHYRTAQIAKQWLIPVFGDVRLDELRRQDVEEYKSLRQAAPGTVAKELRTLQAIMNKAIDWEIIGRNPIKGVKPPQDLDDTPPRYFTESELLAIYEASEWRRYWWRWMANTGLRRAEALGARWEDIRGGVMVVLSTGHTRTKSGKSRGVPLSPGALEALDGIQSARGGSRSWDPDYVLPRMYPRSLSRCFEVDIQRAGISGRLHDLRHTYCSHLALREVPLRTIQQLAGHANSKTTERYTKLLGLDLAPAVAQLSI